MVKFRIVGFSIREHEAMVKLHILNDGAIPTRETNVVIPLYEEIDEESFLAYVKDNIAKLAQSEGNIKWVEENQNVAFEI